ncbi:MAG: 3-hydroxybutyryl-CoA dehydrogenase [Gemmatimonadota bacterium]|nr:3-hydroxybutyryl-CoA dehydrogenase [Candidatus Palauibacterales bacterium]
MTRAAVVGAGTMGNGVAHVFAQSGFEVILVDVSEDLLENALAAIKKNMDRQVKKGSLDEAARDSALDRIQVATDLSATSAAEVVVEAVPENQEVKERIFHTLDEVTPAGVILASNTSSVSITALAAQTGRPERVIGMHFMNPVPVMQLIEIVRGLATSDETVERITQLSRDLGKTPVLVRDSPGFVSNRVLMPMINEAIFCVHEGVAEAEAIDEIMKLGMNHPIGPLALADLIGLDTCLFILNVLHSDLGDDKYRACPLLRNYVAAGWLGRKTGRGFYTY